MRWAERIVLAMCAVSVAVGLVLVSSAADAAAPPVVWSIQDGQPVPVIPPELGYPYTISQEFRVGGTQPSAASVAGVDDYEISDVSMLPPSFTGLARFTGSFPSGHVVLYAWFEEGQCVQIRTTGEWGSSASAYTQADKGTVTHAVEAAGGDFVDTLLMIGRYLIGVAIGVAVAVAGFRLVRRIIGG